MSYEEHDKDILSTFISIVKTRKLVFLAGMLSVLLTCAVGLYLFPLKYKAQAKIVINLPAIPKNVMPYLTDLRNRSVFLKNQREILRSRKICEQVVKELKLDESSKELSLVEKIKKALFKTDINPVESAIDDLLKATSVKILRGTNIIQISARASSSVKAANIVNTFIKKYINEVNTNLSVKTQNAYNFVEAKLKASLKQLKEAQKALGEFYKRENVVSPTSIEEAVSEQKKKIQEYEAKYDEIDGKLKKIDYQLATGNYEFTPMSSASDENKTQESSLVKKLEKDLNELRAELNNARRTHTDKHPYVVALRVQVEKLEKRLEDARANSPKSLVSDNRREKSIESQKEFLESMKRKLLTEKRDISEKIDEAKGKLNRIMESLSELNRLTQEIESREREVRSLREQLGRASILKVNNTRGDGYIKVIDAAYPPDFPEIKKLVIFSGVGLIVSVFFGVGLAFIAEYFDDSIRRREEIEKDLGLTVLGELPVITRKMKSAMRKGYSR